MKEIVDLDDFDFWEMPVAKPVKTVLPAQPVMPEIKIRGEEIVETHHLCDAIYLLSTFSMGEQRYWLHDDRRKPSIRISKCTYLSLLNCNSNSDPIAKIIQEKELVD